MPRIRALCVTRLVCVLTILALVAPGCRSMHRVPLTTPPESSSWRISAGDQVRVTLQDGRRVRFKVQTADGHTLVAQDGTRYERADIVTVERRSFSVTKTALLAAGIWFGLFVIAAIAVASDDRFLL